LYPYCSKTASPEKLHWSTMWVWNMHWHEEPQLYTRAANSLTIIPWNTIVELGCF
jgi:hypothetical protein